MATKKPLLTFDSGVALSPETDGSDDVVHYSSPDESALEADDTQEVCPNKVVDASPSVQVRLPDALLADDEARMWMTELFLDASHL